MERRQFLVGMAALPLLGMGRLPLRRTVLDYRNTYSDQYGAMYRRVLLHPDIPTVCVRRAEMESDGRLYVHCYNLDLNGVPLGPKYPVEHSYMEGRIKVLCGHIDEWKLEQCDERGRVIHLLTKRDFM